MGNRAVITTQRSLEEDGPGVYVHWNGGRDSVEAFLRYCRIRSFRPPERDFYGWARLAQVICNFICPEGDSVGIDSVSRLDKDNWDNGTYVIEDWRIINRMYTRGEEQDVHDVREFVMALDERQPEGQQIGRQLLEVLYDNDMGIDDIDSFYFVKVNFDEGEPFQVGRSYMSYRDDDKVAQVIGIQDGLITVRFGGETHTVPRFRWRNGDESFHIGCGRDKLDFRSRREVMA